MDVASQQPCSESEISALEKDVSGKKGFIRNLPFMKGVKLLLNQFLAEAWDIEGGDQLPQADLVKLIAAKAHRDGGLNLDEVMDVCLKSTIRALLLSSLKMELGVSATCLTSEAVKVR